MGAICPAELWRIIESAVPASELMASLNGIDERAQTTLRRVYRDRPISRSGSSRLPSKEARKPKRAAKWARADRAESGGMGKGEGKMCRIVLHHVAFRASAARGRKSEEGSRAESCSH